MLYLYGLNEKQHQSLIDYSFSICNSISFVVTKFDGNEDYYDDFCLHNKNTLKLIEKLNLNVIKTIDGKYQYGSQVNDYQSVIYFATLHDGLKKFLYQYKFEKWRFPKLPEDLIFYRNNNIWLETVTHEKIIWIHNESKEDIDFLNKHRIKFRYEN